eukprot:gene4837-8422_t
MSDCNDSFEAYSNCLKKQLTDKNVECSFLLNAHNMCLKKTTFQKEAKTILEKLKINPKTPTKKICCVCPETKKVRDECHILGDESKCKKYYNAHKLCLLNEGFKIEM